MTRTLKQFGQDLLHNCEKQFGYLKTDFSCHVAFRQIESWGIKIGFKNNVAGVIVTFEFREHRFFVLVCRLVDGKFDMGPGEIRPDTTLHCYDLDGILLLRAPQEMIPPYQTGVPIPKDIVPRMLVQIAKSVRTYAEDILRGDFSIFTELDMIVKKRAREAALQKWGARASEFGWK